MADIIIRKVTLGISLSLMILSLTQKCYCTDNGCADSLAVFLSGILGFYFSWAGLTWLANPLLILSWITFKKHTKWSTAASLFATIISLSFLFFTQIMDNEGGYMSQIISYRIGYWLWVMSPIAMLLGNLRQIYFGRP